MNLPLFVAGRYLFARKSHNVINIISAISSIGMAIGVAALIIILSVYNGFDDIIKSSLSDIDPDYLITPEKGKVFVPDSCTLDSLSSIHGVASVCRVLQDNVFISYDGRQSVAIAKGVPDLYQSVSGLGFHLRGGDFKLYEGSMPQCAVGASLASSLGINPNFVAPLELFFPVRDRDISLANPMASIESVSMHPSAVFSISADVDASLIVVPLDLMRTLMDYDSEVTGLEVRVDKSLNKSEKKNLELSLKGLFGPGFDVSDRISQNAALYKMMKYEKASIFMILIFVIIIIAFNVFGSLSMLIIDKKDDINTFRSFGAPDGLIRRFFVLEGWLTSLLGMVAGLAVGVLLSLVQQRFGIIKIPGNYLVSSYPVVLQWWDVAVTFVSVTIIGYLIALVPVSSSFPKE